MGSSWSGDEPDVSALMNHADQLMYIAKQNYYKTTYNLSKHYRPETYQQLMEALKENRFTVYIQPKAELGKRTDPGWGSLDPLSASADGCDSARALCPGAGKRTSDSGRLLSSTRSARSSSCRQRQSRNAAVLSLNFSRLTLLEENMALGGGENFIAL